MIHHSILSFYPHLINTVHKYMQVNINIVTKERLVLPPRGNSTVILSLTSNLQRPSSSRHSHLSSSFAPLLTLSFTRIPGHYLHYSSIYREDEEVAGYS